MGVLKGLRDTKYYTLGCSRLHVFTDHRPLVPILNTKTLADIENPRLMKICEKLLWWKFETIWCPGKLNVTADTISQVKSSGKSMIIGNNKQDEDEVAIHKAVINSIGTDLEALTW